MKQEIRMKNIHSWRPFIFCSFLSSMAIFIGKNAMPAFYSFLPMCFLFSAISVCTMQKKIDDLEKQLTSGNS
jgi:hypothetical protein